MIPNWEEWLVHQRVVVQPRESLTGWNNGLAGASCNSTRISVESAARGEEQAHEPERQPVWRGCLQDRPVLGGAPR